MPRTAIAAAALLSVMLAAAPGAQAQEEGFACEVLPHRYEREKIAGLAQNREMEFIVKQRIIAWDAKYAREQCDAYVNNRPYFIGCLNGKRDWKEIKSSIPSTYFNMNRDALKPIVANERRARSPFNEAMDYCRSIGAIRVR